MIKGVLFDMDGLMFDTESVYTIYWKKLAEDRGLTMTEDMVGALRGTTKQAHLLQFHDWFGMNEEQGDALIEECHACTAAHIDRNPVPYKDGLLVLLKELNARGIPAAVATATRRARTEELLARAGIRDCFAATVCGDEVKKGKPDPEVFLRAAAAIGVPPEECIVLEDSHNGIRAAKAAGAMPIMVPDLAPVTDEMRALCTHILPSLNEVIPLL